MSSPALDLRAEPGEELRPYPGLRPFEPHEAAIFFGRDRHSDRLLQILQRERFLSVIGPSGCGKSSLVRAGLLPAVNSGWLGTGMTWRIVIMRPGTRPHAQLAHALVADDGLGPELLDPASGGADVEWVEAELTRGPRGLIDTFRAAAARVERPERYRLLLVVDQFEELFTHARTAGPYADDEAQAFVNLLLAPRAEKETGIHIVMTMRADFLGHCVRFLDLPDVINQTQFLTPRLTHDEIVEAIVGPALLSGGGITDDAVGRLINGVGADSDQLPILQHALSRMWINAWQERQSKRMDATDLEDIGGVEGGLSRHADDIYARLSDHDQVLAEQLFRFLTERNGVEGASQDVRRPRSLIEIAAAIEGCEWRDLEPVVKAFAAEDVSFLVDVFPIDPERRIDISHEALIRKWTRLQEWVADEARRAAAYRGWRERALQYGLLVDVDLAQAIRWRDGVDENGIQLPVKPTARWAERYALKPGDGQKELETTIDFITRSEEAARKRQQDEERERQQKVRELRRRLLVATAFAILLAGTATVAFMFGVRATRAEEKALHSAREALDLRGEALKYAKEKGEAARRASIAEALAERAESVARDEARSAAIERNRAVIAEGLAKASAIQAREQADRASTAEGIAKIKERESSARQLMVRSETAAQTDSDHAQLLAVEAYNTLPFADTENQLRAMRFRYSGLLHSLIKHTEPVWDLAFSPDGKRLVTASNDRTARVWDVATGAPLLMLRGHVDSLTGAAFSPDGRRIVTTSADNSARLWDAASGRELLKLAGTGAVLNAAFSRDGRRIVTGDADGTVRLWDALAADRPIDPRAEAAEPLQSAFRADGGPVEKVSFSPDGKLIVTATHGQVQLWDASTGQVVARINAPGAGLAHAVFSPDGRQLAVAADDGVLLWDVLAGPKATIAVRDVTDLVFSHGSTIVAGTPNGAKLWNPMGGSVSDLDTDQEGVISVAFSPDGQTIAAAGSDGTVRTWDLNGRPVSTFHGHHGTVWQVAFSADGRVMATAGQDHTARLWDASTGRPTATVASDTGTPMSGAYRADGAAIVTDGYGVWNVGARQRTESLAGLEKPQLYSLVNHDASIALTADAGHVATLWDVRGGRALASFTGHEGPIRHAAFNPRRPTVATASDDGSVRLWDVRSGRLLGTFLHEQPVRFVAFNHAGTRMVTTSDDNRVRLWDADGFGAPLRILAVHERRVVFAAFDPSDSRIVTASLDKTAALWDVGSGSARALEGHRSGVTGTAFSPDGKLVATISADKTAKLWESDTGRLQGTLLGHEGPIASVKFGPDGKTLVTTGYDKTVRLWDASTRNSIAILHVNDAVSDAVFRDDGAVLLTLSQDGTAQLWDLSATRRTPQQMADEIRQRVGRELTDEERAAAGLPARNAADAAGMTAARSR